MYTRVTYIGDTPDFHRNGRYDCLNSPLFPSLGSVFDVLRVPLFEGVDLRDLFMDFQLFYSFGKRQHRAITCCMLAFHNLTSGHVTRYTTSDILNMQKHLLLLHLTASWNPNYTFSFNFLFSYRYTKVLPIYQPIFSF